MKNIFKNLPICGVENFRMEIVQLWKLVNLWFCEVEDFRMEKYFNNKNLPICDFVEKKILERKIFQQWKHASLW